MPAGRRERRRERPCATHVRRCVPPPRTSDRTRSAETPRPRRACTSSSRAAWPCLFRTPRRCPEPPPRCDRIARPRTGGLQLCARCVSFELQVWLEAVQPAFAPEAGLLVAAERRRRVEA